MCEYNENHSQKDNTAEVTYYPEKRHASKYKKGNPVLKVFLLLSVMAIVSVTSITIYSAFDDETNDPVYSTTANCTSFISKIF